MNADYAKELIKKGHSDVKKGVKKVKTSLELFEKSRITEDIEKYADPYFDEEDEDEEE